MDLKDSGYFARRGLGALRKSGFLPAARAVPPSSSPRMLRLGVLRIKVIGHVNSKGNEDLKF